MNSGGTFPSSGYYYITIIMILFILVYVYVSWFL